MSSAQALIRSCALCAALLNLFALYYFGVRPWHLSWGATAAELQRALPGDELVPAAPPGSGSTRAITIRAAPSAVWPWLAQLGQDRAGFYSYELLEDLVGCSMPHTDRIHPEFQAWRVGDKLWMYPPERLDGMGHAQLARYEPGRVFAFATRQVGTPGERPYDGMWNFVLEASDADSTRLLVRGRAAGERGFWASVFDRLVFEPAHFIMERRMMEEVKGLAEGHPSSRLALQLQPVCWAALALLAALCGLWVVRGRRWPLSLALFILSSLTLMGLCFLQPAAWVGVAISVCLWLLTFLPQAVRLRGDDTLERAARV